jgi:hypothetical protein
MASRVYSRPTYNRYLGNDSSTKMEVHDLQNESTQCQIDEIIRAGHGVVFSPDSADQARREGFNNCHWCIGGSTR